MTELEAAVYYPVINTEHCGADYDCVEVCDQSVIEEGFGTLEPFIAHPDRCVDGCTLCVGICTMNAISLKTEHLDVD
ncbi:MAG TPA: ferredoxin family protein [Bryobacteraceae bacterium]|nr:ferredoxin family protein [Bryobacteraceae bacterium]